MIHLTGEQLSLRDAWLIARGEPVGRAESARERVERGRRCIVEKLDEGLPLYGINTGFGYLANTAIDPESRSELQRNILRSHAAGWGPSLSPGESRLILALRLNAFLKGYSGVRLALCERLEQLLAADISPVIPECGSVGSSGDLIPLAHAALPLMGEGTVYYRGEIVAAAEALNRAGIAPLELEVKEGLSLVNGTQAMLSVGGLALAEAIALARLADQIVALTFEGLQGNIEALDDRIHRARGHVQQRECAARIRESLRGSRLEEPTRKRIRVQDAYSLRCAPHVHGAATDALLYAQSVVEPELNAATDNPLVFTDTGEILSGGNFHGEALALAFDFAAMGASELANISERRLELLVNPHYSGLPAFLTPEPGMHSGLMALQYLAASAVNENKVLSHPASTDSIPGNVGTEDHVSMGMTSAKKLKQVATNVRCALACELIAAAQAIDLRGQSVTGAGSAPLYTSLRNRVARLEEDRILSDDIDGTVALLDELIAGYWRREQ